MRAPRLQTRVRRDQIAGAALAVVAARGMKALSIAAVARRVGLAPSAIYRHFRGRDEVLDAALEQMRERILGNVAAARAASPHALDRLHSLVRRQVQFIRRNLAFPRVLFSEDVYGGGPARRAKAYGMLRDYIDQVAEICRQGQLEGQVREDLDPGTVAVLFIGVVHPAAVLGHLSDGRFDAARQAERSWRLLRAMLEPSSRAGRRRAPRR